MSSRLCRGFKPAYCLIQQQEHLVQLRTRNGTHFNVRHRRARGRRRFLSSGRPAPIGPETQQTAFTPVWIAFQPER
jgi:hypothetical protein